MLRHTNNLYQSDQYLNFMTSIIQFSKMGLTWFIYLHEFLFVEHLFTK